MNPAHVTPQGIGNPTDRGNHRPTNDTLFQAPIGDHALHAALEPLNAFKSKMALIRGVSGRIALSDHSANHGALAAKPTFAAMPRGSATG